MNEEIEWYLMCCDGNDNCFGDNTKLILNLYNEYTKINDSIAILIDNKVKIKQEQIINKIDDLVMPYYIADALIYGW